MTGTGELLHPARARYCTVQCSTVYGVLFCTAQHRTPSSWTQSEVCCRQSNNWSGRVEHSELVASTGTASPAVSSVAQKQCIPRIRAGTTPDQPTPVRTGAAEAEEEASRQSPAWRGDRASSRPPARPPPAPPAAPGRAWPPVIAPTTSTLPWLPSQGDPLK